MLNIEEFAESNELFDGHYALIRPLSVDGATADVWLALDVNTVSDEIDTSDVARLSDDEIDKLGLMVAIKVYRPQNALDIEGKQRFANEFMIVFNCHHTNLIHPTHYSIFRDTPYLVLPYCKLGSSELLIGNQFDDESIWKYILDVSSGLAYLHALTPPIVHQDIKPANILLDDTLHYAITDFGISSQKGGVHGSYHDEENSGTLAYMAPERFQEGAQPIPQSDIWALGATLCEILTGDVPFGEEGGRAQVEEKRPMPDIPGVSADVQRIVHACLAKDPKDRPTADQIVQAAEEKLHPAKSRKGLFVAVLTAGVIFMGAAAFFLTRPKPLPVEDVPSVEEVYSKALRLMNSESADSLITGIALMDSISKFDYVPALYELAHTYGWFNDSISMSRKVLLNIDFETVKNKEGTPKDDRTKIKALGLFNKIVELSDSAYPVENGRSYYRLAHYFSVESNEKEAVDKAKEYLTKAKEWAIVGGDVETIEIINKILR